MSELDEALRQACSRQFRDGDLSILRQLERIADLEAQLAQFQRINHRRLCGCEESAGVFGCGVGCACRCHVIEAQLAERDMRRAAMREALESARCALASPTFPSLNASETLRLVCAALASDAGWTCWAALIERCAKAVVERRNPRVSQVDQIAVDVVDEVVAAIRALAKEGT